MSESTKGALRSSAVWGGIVAALPALDALLVGLKVIPIPVLGEVAGILVPAVGGLLAIFGRVKAEKKIKGVL